MKTEVTFCDACGESITSAVLVSPSLKVDQWLPIIGGPGGPGATPKGHFRAQFLLGGEVLHGDPQYASIPDLCGPCFVGLLRKAAKQLQDDLDSPVATPEEGPS